jgi:carbon storage regulator CsrA
LRLARTAGESIIVDGDIEFRIMHVGNNRVQVGVIAPGREILRAELCWVPLRAIASRRNVNESQARV